MVLGLLRVSVVFVGCADRGAGSDGGFDGDEGERDGGRGSKDLGDGVGY